MQLDLNQPATGSDLARLLEGDQGTFIAQTNGGYTFLVTSGQGHSIRSIRPLATSGSSGSEQWCVTKISSKDVSEDSSEVQSYRAAGGSAQRS